MNIKEIFASVLKAFRTIVAWILMVLGGLLAGICALCAVLALFGGLETDSFREQLTLFVIFLILLCVGICMMIEGRWIKNGKKQVKHAMQKAPKPELPQPTENQKRLEAIDRNIDDTAGAIQANPMSPGKTADEELLKKLQQEKHALLKRIAAHSENITVRDAWNTFTPRQQKQFDAQLYQYSQDVGRGGLDPEIAAANRGLTFVDHKPVPVEVAARFEELKEAAAAEKVRGNRFFTDQRAEILRIGESIYCSTQNCYTGLNNRDYADEASQAAVKYILAEERFVTNHDDTAMFIELIDGSEKVIKSWKFDYPMKKHFNDPDYYEDDCLVFFLRETFHLPTVGYRGPKPEVLTEMKKTLHFTPTSPVDLQGYQMDMHTDSGEKYHFILSGLVNFSPNRSSMCGYGCDAWMFHCTLEGEDYILNFFDEASFGRAWRCVPISREDAERLKALEAADWLHLMAKSENKIYHLHPDHAAEARAVMQINASRCGPISDADFYGVNRWVNISEKSDEHGEIYEPATGRPAGNIEILQHLSTTETKQNGAFDFEKTLEKREFVKAEDGYYIRVTEYQCSAEANGRPVYSYTESYHVCNLREEKMRQKLLTADSGLDVTAKSAAYRYEESGTGVLF